MASCCMAGSLALTEVSTSSVADMRFEMTLSEAEDQSLQFELGPGTDGGPDWKSCAKGPERKLCICAGVMLATPTLDWVMPNAAWKAASTACLAAEGGLDE